MLRKSLFLNSVALIAVAFGLGSHAFAAQNGAFDLLSSIKDTKVTGQDQIQVSNLRSLILVNDSFEGSLSEDMLRRRASQIGKAVALRLKDDIKPLTILFSDKANNTREISFDAEQLRAFAAGDESFVASVALNAAEQAMTQAPAAASPAPAGYVAFTVSSIKATQNQFQTERARVAGRIDVLKAKGVGVNPFVDELSKIDDQYKRADVAGATNALTRLDDSISQQEKARQDAQVALASRPAPSVQMVAPKGAPARSIEAARPNESIANFNGNVDDFVDKMVTQIVSKELGQYVPHKGPFMVERFRIAKRIHELEDQRMNVSGYANLYKKMEDIVASRDARRLPELSMNVQYLQQQLGLAQLQGKLHRPLNL
jgi:hypothetical protein